MLGKYQAHKTNGLKVFPLLPSWSSIIRQESEQAWTLLGKHRRASSGGPGCEGKAGPAFPLGEGQAVLYTCLRVRDSGLSKKNVKALRGFPDAASVNPHNYGKELLKTKPYFNAPCKDSLFPRIISPITMHRLTCFEKMCYRKSEVWRSWP